MDYRSTVALEMGRGLRFSPKFGFIVINMVVWAPNVYLFLFIAHQDGEYRGSSKRYTSTPLVTPRKALGELSNNVKATPLHSDSKRKVLS